MPTPVSGLGIPKRAGEHRARSLGGQFCKIGERIVSSSLPVRETRGRHPLET